jgi:hypothetical protein
MSRGDRDRLEEKLRDKEQADEDRYFRERDRRLLERMKPARTVAEGHDPEHAPDMRCPRCGARLEKEHLLGVTADACPECAGLWLERAALERAVAPRKPPGWLARWFGRTAAR